jgi:comEA protein
MKFNNLKRKAFFWIEKLQISRKERLAFSLMLVILTLILLGNAVLTNSFNYEKEQYDQLLVEFEKRSALIEKEQNALEEKYNPALAVNEMDDTNEPAKAEKASIGETNTSSTQEAEAGPKPETIFVNINSGTSAQLQTLDGIGPAYAQRIIEYREANDGFDSIDELLNVRGIGPVRLENVRPYIILDD